VSVHGEASPGVARFGVSVHDVDALELLEIARAAENAGFASLWFGEHVVVPYGHSAVHPTDLDGGQNRDSRYPQGMDPASKLLDPLVALAAVAASTERIRIATGIYLLTMRHPLVAARGLSTLAQIAPDRLVIGLGSGWLQEEFEALGIPFAERGRRYDESLEILRLAFRGGPFEYAGQHFSFGPLHVSETPVRAHIVLGGNSDRALRRAAAVADGWFASGTPTLEEAIRLRDQLERFRVEEGRPEPLEHFIRVPFDPDTIASYEDAGFRNMLFWLRDICLDGDPAPAFEHAAAALGIEATAP
jgi:probable F420-dependent oxidoreductase